MTNFLAPILRIQFNLFYRYGYTYIPSAQIIKLDGTITEELKVKIVELFKEVCPFEYDDEYVIIHFEKNEDNSQPNQHIEIQDLISVFPLSKQAKLSIESKMDSRIKLEDPIFENYLSAIENNILSSEISRAIDSLWYLFKIKDDKKEIIKVIGIENILKGLEYRRNAIKAFKINDANFWSLLIAYDRYDYFPNTPIGYFFDAGQVFGFSKNRPTFEGSKLYTFLQKSYSENPHIKTSSFIELLESEKSVEEYISQSKSDGLRQYVVAPIFLMLKEELRKYDDFKKIDLNKYIEKLQKYGVDASAALILIGAFFGYKKFYDLYYDELNLRFFNKQPSKSSPGTIKEEYLKNEAEKETTLESAENQEQNSDSQPTYENGLKEPPMDPEIEVEKHEEKDPSKVKLNVYQRIIYEELKEKSECKLSDLSKIISTKIKGKKFNNENIKKIISEMPESKIEIYKEKNTPIARLKK
jgi:hypothetical protein